jgi:hypothetical protein
LDFYTCNYKLPSNSHLAAHSKEHCNCSIQKVFSIFTSHCLVAASNGTCSSFSDFPKSSKLRVLAYSHNCNSQLGQPISIGPSFTVWHRPHRKHPFHYYVLPCCRKNNASRGLLTVVLLPVNIDGTSHWFCMSSKKRIKDNEEDTWTWEK